ncbi:universal stress protein [Maribacter chungangensis]|uniref:Universal stress protein n=1 Tax=Maribacter chungangensis TaxID=1069117 RepID=A0ABW3B5K8_9FLAO
MKKILLPTDFSQNSENAINYAIQLFEKESCTFFLLHAYYSAPSSPITKTVMQNNLDEAVSSLQKDNKNKSYDFKGILMTDSVVNAINITFINQGIDYVVMGTQGSSALREVFLGSNTLSVIKHIDRCPVLVVPTEYHYQIPKEIMLATDYKHAFVPAELNPLTAFSKLWNSRISIVHIATQAILSDAQLANKTLLKTALDQTDYGFINLRKQDTLANTLLSFKKEDKDIALFAMMRTKHGFFDTIFREPVIKTMAFQTPIPFLVLPMLK